MGSKGAVFDSVTSYIVFEAQMCTYKVHILLGLSGENLIRNKTIHEPLSVDYYHLAVETGKRFLKKCTFT